MLVFSMASYGVLAQQNQQGQQDTVGSSAAGQDESGDLDDETESEEDDSEQTVGQAIGQSVRLQEGNYVNSAGDEKTFFDR